MSAEQTIERHMFKQDGNLAECGWTEPGPGRACRMPKDHLVHTPAGMTREAWLHDKAKAVGHTTRDAVRVILDEIRYNADENDVHAVAHVVEALHDLVDQVQHWRDAWAHTTVDADRRYRDALRRAESCTEHGRMITELEGQLHHFDDEYRRADAGRVALLGAVAELDGLVSVYDAVVARHGELPNTSSVVDLMRMILEAAHKEHGRVWKS